MEIATMTDATMVPGTDVHYLWHIYVVLLLILALFDIILWLLEGGDVDGNSNDD